MNDNVIISLSAIELIEDNDDLKIVWDAMRTRWDKNARAKVKTFNELDLVNVKFKDGYYRCRVTKVNQKTVGVTILEGPWRGRKASRIHTSYVTKVTQEMLDAERQTVQIARALFKQQGFMVFIKINTRHKGEYMRNQVLEETNNHDGFDVNFWNKDISINVKFNTQDIGFGKNELVYYGKNLLSKAEQLESIYHQLKARS